MVFFSKVLEILSGGCAAAFMVVMESVKDDDRLGGIYEIVVAMVPASRREGMGRSD